MRQTWHRGRRQSSRRPRLPAAWIKRSLTARQQPARGRLLAGALCQGGGAAWPPC